MKKHEKKGRKMKKKDYKTKISIHMPSKTPDTHTDGTWKEILVLQPLFCFFFFTFLHNSEEWRKIKKSEENEEKKKSEENKEK